MYLSRNGQKVRHELGDLLVPKVAEQQARSVLDDRIRGQLLLLRKYNSWHCPTERVTAKGQSHDFFFRISEAIKI